jgi:NDP-sugar pyrophosphorylase family protein
MAGGKGERLRPLTENTPKPMLKIGDKPILEHNINWLKSFGIKNFHISVNYLKEQIITYFENFSKEEISIEFVTENQPLGTIGSVSLASEFKNDYVLIINSDILNNINYEDFFLDFLEKNAALSVATVPYKVNVPYAIFEFENEHIKSLVEKPTYTYYANGGIYLVKKEYLSLIPTHTFYNATDFTEALIAQGKKVISFPIVDYWLDIGKKEDYNKAQEDIKHLKLN